MTQQIKGIIEAANDKGAIKGKFGTQYRVSIKVDGEWYNGFMNKSAESLGLEEGRLVTFTAVQKGDFLNIDPKSLKVSPAPAEASGSKAPAQGKPAYSGNSSTAGIKVGHAINNAVNLAIAEGKTDLRTIHTHAARILALSVKLEAQFPTIVGKADEIYAKATGEAEQSAPAEKASSAEGKKTTKAPAKKKAAPPPPPEEEEEEGEGEEADQPDEQDSGPSFDDDIPF